MIRIQHPSYQQADAGCYFVIEELKGLGVKKCKLVYEKCYCLSTGSTSSLAFPPWLNQQNESRCSKVHRAEIRKNQGVVALGNLQDIAAKPWTKRPRHKAIGCKNQPENGPEIRHAKTISCQGTRNRKKSSESVANNRCQYGP